MIKKKSIWGRFEAQVKALLQIHPHDKDFVEDLVTYFTEEERSELHPLIVGCYRDRPGTGMPGFYNSFGSRSYDEVARRMYFCKDLIINSFTPIH